MCHALHPEGEIPSVHQTCPLQLSSSLSLSVSGIYSSSLSSFKPKTSLGLVCWWLRLGPGMEQLSVRDSSWGDQVRLTGVDIKELMLLPCHYNNYYFWAQDDGDDCNIGYSSKRCFLYGVGPQTLFCLSAPHPLSFCNPPTLLLSLPPQQLEENKDQTRVISARIFKVPPDWRIGSPQEEANIQNSAVENTSHHITSKKLDHSSGHNTVDSKPHPRRRRETKEVVGWWCKKRTAYLQCPNLCWWCHPRYVYIYTYLLRSQQYTVCVRRAGVCV